MFSSLNARALGLALTAEETIDLAAEAGFGGVDLLVRDLVDRGEDPADLRARLEDRGLRGGAFPFPFNWRGSEAEFRAGLDQLPALSGAAAALGLLRTGTWVMVETPERPESEAAIVRHRAEVVALHVERLGAIARVLDRAGVRLGIEVLGPVRLRTGRGLPFVGRLADLDPTLGALWSEAPNFGVVLDNFHLYAADEPVDAGLARGVNRVVWAHVSDLPAGDPPDRDQMDDMRRGLPGEHGAIDSVGFLKRLAAEGYDGPVMAEPMAGCRSLAGLPPDLVACRAADSLRRAWPDGAAWPLA